MTDLVSATSWHDHAIARLVDASTCPVCGDAELATGRCPRCGAELSGPAGTELWNASYAAAVALRARRELLGRIPRTSPPLAVAPAPPSGTTSPPVAQSAPPASPPPATAPAAPWREPRSSATLQSVLAVAGAGLFAVAAIVFTFFNPDLADRALRSVIVGVVTLVFLGGSWVLARRRLQFSAEAVGGLGVVFAGLDVYAVAQLAAPGVSAWLPAAGATFVGAGIMLAAGLVARVRIWVWTALLGIAAVPAMLGYGAGSPAGVVAGHLGATFVAAAVVEMILPRISGPFPSGPDSEREGRRGVLRPERVALLVVQFLASLAALIGMWALPMGEMVAYLAGIAATLALVAVHALVATRQPLARFWSYAAGGTGAAAVTVAVYALAYPIVAEHNGFGAILPTGAAIGLVLVGAVLPLPGTSRRGFVVGGALTLFGLVAAVPLLFAAATGLEAAAAFLRLASIPSSEGGAWGWPFVVGLAAVAAGLALFGVVARRRPSIRGAVRVTDPMAVAVGALVILQLGWFAGMPSLLRIGVVVTFAAAVGVGLRVVPRLRLAPSPLRAILLVAAHAAVIVSVTTAWTAGEDVLPTGVASLVAWVFVAGALRPAVRFWHVGAGYGYALILVGTGLQQADVGGVVLLCLTASAGLIGAIVATYLPRIGARAWLAILVVAVVPFGLGVVQVLFERSGWTALSTGLMFLLALSLLLTRRPGLTTLVRTGAAGLLVPSASVVIVCLGAQVLAGSASPVTLPVIAAMVALVLPATVLIRRGLLARGFDERAVRSARAAIEGSALLTAALAVVLALVREASGLGTTFLVLVILGVGLSAAAVVTARRYAWPAAGVAYTGALWCLLAMSGVDVVEPYLLPPTLGVALVATVLTSRGFRATGLYAAGLVVAAVPLLGLLVLTEADATTAVDPPIRALGLLAGAAALLIFAASFGRGRSVPVLRLRVLRVPTFAVAGLLGVAGGIQGIRFGTGMDLVALQGAGLFFACLGVSAAGAVVIVLAGRGLRAAAPEGSGLRRSRWLSAPALLVLSGGSWFAIERDWFSIWAMWTLMLALLIGMVAIAERSRERDTILPPVWFVFACAFVTAIVAWSPRDLRVEWFSLPLGLFLLVTGALAMRRARGAAEGSAASPTLDSWPGRWRGSWALLAPGIVVSMLASIVATFTDPLTWRAILVIVVALAAILWGAGRRLAAPFLLGLIVLPIENVFVFAVQIGRGIESMPWWITLAVVGAVLLIIAVTAERRAGEETSVVSRIRDLQ
ncbi:MAG: SCO7613 C-terminal domain-containing membrane protein [Actinomycetota bacterium]